MVRVTGREPSSLFPSIGALGLNLASQVRANRATVQESTKKMGRTTWQLHSMLLTKTRRVLDNL